jgi:hypothetical protein
MDLKEIAVGLVFLNVFRVCALWSETGDLLWVPLSRFNPC